MMAKSIVYGQKGDIVESIYPTTYCRGPQLCKHKFKLSHQWQDASFRTRHDRKQTIFIPKSAINPAHGVYYTLLGDIKTYEPIPAPRGDCRLTLWNNRWFVSVPIATDAKAENQGRTVAIDPGVRTFATFYSSESCGKIGTGDFSRIQRLCYYLDDLISRMSKAAHKQRHKMKKAAERMRWKIRDLIDELHHKAALFFVKNFDGYFYTQI
ncbi:hypothetical protein AGMMS50276_18950 [Synergistales bacterium]|nr:hypothetical protein AGMMS50276_18950 [Synergistales bacterium]